MSEATQQFVKSLTRAMRPMIAAVVATLIFICLPLITGGSAQQTQAASGSVIKAIDAVKGTIMDMESDASALFDTGDTAGRDSFNASAGSLDSSIDSIGRLPGATVDQQKIDDAKAAVDAWSAPLSAAVTGWLPTSGARPHVAGDSDARSAAFKQLDAVEDAARAASDQALRSQQTMGTLFFVLALLSAAVGLYFAYSLVGSARSLYAAAIDSRESQIDSLRKNRALLLTTMDSIGDGLIATDVAARITFMNPLAERMTGWQENDAVGKEIVRTVNLVSEKTKEAIELPIASVLRQNVEKDLAPNAMIKSQDGALTPVTGQAVPVWDEGGKVSGVALILRDVTEKRGAREAIKTSEAHKEAIIDNALEGVMMIDSAGKIIEFNASAESAFGYGRVDVLGMPATTIFPPASARDSDGYSFQRFLQTRDLSIVGKRIEIIGVRKDNVEFPLEIAITQVPRQEPPVFAAFLRDISDRKAAELVLIAAKEAAEAESRDKSQFLNNMSDELRTPLNAVIGYSEMLQDEIGERKPAEMVPDLKKINEAGRHLLMLVNDVLDLSRIEAGKMDLFVDSFDLTELVEDLSRSATALAERNQNKVRVSVGDSLGTMQSDRNKIRQCVLYLINNACKFAHERELELEITRAGTWVKFKMSDLSPGIADDAMYRLADAFASAKPNSSLRFGGHGLGLVIAKNLCEMMGGELTGARPVGHSPTYTMRLPDKIATK